MIHIGHIGIGKFGKYYLNTIQNLHNAKLKAMCASSKETLQKYEDTVDPDTIKTTDYNDLLTNQDIHAITLATPPSTHFEIAKKALEHDKHVLVEKPFVFSLDEARELVQLAKQKNLILMVGHIHCYQQALQKLKQDIKENEFGELRYIRSAHAQNGPIRKDFDIMWDAFPHDISVSLFMLDAFPETLQAQSASYNKNQLSDIATFKLTYQNNITHFSFITWLYPGKKRYFTFVGSKKAAVFDETNKESKLSYFDHDDQTVFKQPQPIQISDELPLTSELKHFVHCIQTNTEPITSNQHILNVTYLLEKAQQSAKQDGSLLKLEEPCL